MDRSPSKRRLHTVTRRSDGTLKQQVAASEIPPERFLTLRDRWPAVHSRGPRHYAVRRPIRTLVSAIGRLGRSPSMGRPSRMNSACLWYFYLFRAAKLPLSPPFHPHSC